VLRSGSQLAHRSPRIGKRKRRFRRAVNICRAYRGRQQLKAVGEKCEKLSKAWRKPSMAIISAAWRRFSNIIGGVRQRDAAMNVGI